MLHKQTASIPCNLCGANDFHVIFPSTIKNVFATVQDYLSTNNDYCTYHDIVKCKQCGLLYMNPRDVGIPELYSEVEDKAYLETWEERAVTFRDHLRLIKKLKTNGQVLDVGCYAGIFLNEAKQAGFEVSGIEPSKWASEYARQKTGGIIHTGSWSTLRLPENHYDIITLWDVVEHLEDPLGCFRAMYSSLKSDGVIAVTTHDINSLFARILGKNYPWLMRFHLYHYSPETLSKTLEKAGFSPMKTEYYLKRFSLNYLLSRFGIRLGWSWLKKIKIPIYTRDMFLITAKKS